ncbi:MAG: tetratricopeptide repeat protein [Blastocatellia bacterium]|nr:tetratricopeptide repeat protein [Blastocatellia bacterium]
MMRTSLVTSLLLATFLFSTSLQAQTTGRKTYGKTKVSSRSKTIGKTANKTEKKSPASPEKAPKELVERPNYGVALDSLLEQQVELVKISETKADERIKLLEAFVKKETALSAPAYDLLLRARAAVAENYLKQQVAERAVEEFRKAFEELPKPISDRTFLNIWSFPSTVLRYGYREEAIKLMRDFEAVATDNAARLAQVAVFYLNAEDGEDAGRVMKRAVELDPKEGKYFQALASSFLLRLKLDEAAQSYQQAIKLQPKDSASYAGLANIYRSKGELENAEQYYKKQLAITPDHETAHGGLAITYLLGGKEEGLVAEELGKQLAASPRDFRLFAQLAYFLASKQEYQKARRWAELALVSAPTYAWARVAMANVLISQQDYTEAEDLLSDSVARGNNFPTIYFELVKTLLLNENYAGAYEQAERFITIDPEGSFEVNLAGFIKTKSKTFKDLLDKEIKATLGLPVNTTTDDQFQLVESFLRFQFYMAKLKSPSTNGVPASRRQRFDLQVKILESLNQMLSVEDSRKPFRQLWASEQLLLSDIALERAAELCQNAMVSAEEATRLEGSIRDFPELGREARLKLFKARTEHLLGRVRFKQGQLDEARRALKEAASGYSSGVDYRTALWTLAAVELTAGQEREALSLYIRSYNQYDESASIRRSVIENLYRKIHGSLEGLELK